MTNREALNLAIATLSTIATEEAQQAVAIYEKMLSQMDAKNAKSAQYASARKDRKNAQYAEDYAKVVAVFDKVGAPITLTDLIRGESDFHASLTTQKLVQVIKHGDGAIVRAKVKGKMLYGRSEWFPEGTKFVEPEEA